MNCNGVQKCIDDMLDGELSASEHEAMAMHMVDCPTCLELHGVSLDLLIRLRNIPAPEPRRGYEDRMLRFLDKHKSNGQRHHHYWFVSGFTTAAVAIISLWLVLSTDIMLPTNPQSTVTIQLAPHQEHKINLVFNSPVAIKQASLRLQLPPNLEISGYKNRRQLEWAADLKAGANRLALPLIATGTMNGTIQASITHGGKTRTFEITVQTIPHSTDNNIKTLIAT